MSRVAAELQKHFDRCVVIGLHRIPDFYTRLGERLGQSFIELFPAIDARQCKPPPWWKDIPSLWGCGESHRQVIARALSDGIQRLFIMEDDCAFVEDVSAIDSFMGQVPAGWDGVMLGGQVSVHDGHCTPITPLVSQCVQVERLHAYGLSQAGMQKFHDILSEPTSAPNDYRWGDAQEDGRLNVYRIDPFLAYQYAGRSSISGRVEANRIWDERVDVRLRKPQDVPVVSLVCPFGVMERLRDEGIIANGGESPPLKAVDDKTVEAVEVGLADLMANSPPEIVRSAIDRLRYDAAFHATAIFAVWHPTQAIPHPQAITIHANNYQEAVAALAGVQ